MHKYPATSQRHVARPRRQGPRTPSRRSISTRCSNLTAAAERRRREVRRRRSVSLRPAHQHRLDDDDLKRLADKVAAAQSRRRLGRRAGLAADRRRLGDGERRGSQELRHAGPQGLPIAQEARDLGIRPYGVVRIDSAASPSDWLTDPAGNQKKIAETFRQACDVAEGYGERLAAEGEICWGGMHSWKRNGRAAGDWSNRPKTLGFQADMAHTLLYTLGYNAPEDRILPEDYDWRSGRRSTRR